MVKRVNPIDSFGKKIGDIVIDSGAITPQQRDDLYFSMAVFQVAEDQGIDILNGKRAQAVLEAHPTADKMAKLAAAHNVNASSIMAQVEAYRLGEETYPGLRFLNAAQAMGMMSAADKAPFLASQAATRTASEVNKLANGDSTLNLKDALNPKYPPKQFAAEPDYLFAAQNLEQTSKVFLAGIKEKPYLARDKEVQAALTAVELLSAQSFKQSAKDATKLGFDDAAYAMNAARGAQKREINQMSKLAATSVLVDKMQAGMVKVATAFPEHKKDIIKSAFVGGTEVKKLKVFGSLIAPTSKFTKKQMPSLGNFTERLQQERNNAPNQGQGLG